MNKRIRQYVGILVAIIIYFLIHEGAHLLYALSIGTFKQINFMGLGIQIDIHSDMMTDNQMGVFCILGSVATIITAYILIPLIGKISKSSSKIFKACAYYTTIAMLFIDPLYLSVLCTFFGGGDMNGISLIVPQLVARIVYGAILLIHTVIFIKIVLPKYKLSFID